MSPTYPNPSSSSPQASSEKKKSTLTTILCPPDLFSSANGVTANRYGNQFMVIYINEKTDSPSYNNIKPKTKDVNGNPVQSGVTTKGTGNGSTYNSVGFTSGGSARAGTNTATTYAIHLPVPMNIASNFSAEYAAVSLTDETAKVAGDVASTVVKGGAKALGIPRGLSNGINGIVNTASAAIREAKDFAALESQRILNPHSELLFKGIPFRKFTFKYNLVARNKQESEVIDSVVRLLRYYMHPDIEDLSTMFTFPSEFDIEFFQFDANGSYKRNVYLPFITTGVITGLEVNYAGAGEFAVFKDTGAPIDVALQIEFQEVQILNKTVIKQFENIINPAPGQSPTNSGTLPPKK